MGVNGGERYVSREKGLMQSGESAMDEDHFNMEIRKFLKKVGVIPTGIN